MRHAVIGLLMLGGCGVLAPDPEPTTLSMGLPIPESLKSCPTGPPEPPELPQLRTVDMLLASNKALREAYRGMAKARKGCANDAIGAVRWAGANTVIPGKLPVFLKGPSP